MLDLARTVFVVDGQSDRDALKQKLQKEYPQLPSPGFLTIKCNGITVTPGGYANASTSAIFLASKRQFYNVVCILDRETRPISAVDFASSVFQELNARLQDYGANINLFVLCPDRMLENWIVADLEGISVRDFVDCNKIKQDNFDGKNGSAILKRILCVPYSKTAYAASLFKAIDISRARENSPSFDVFCNTVGI